LDNFPRSADDEEDRLLDEQQAADYLKWSVEQLRRDLPSQTFLDQDPNQKPYWRLSFLRAFQEARANAIRKAFGQKEFWQSAPVRNEAHFKRGLYPLPFPDCAVELLFAARSALYGEDAERFKRLEYAIDRFEAEMPTRIDGEIFQIDPIPHEQRGTE
jgi:hypothetical protein